ncbi:restriction endonuclease subunit S [Pseudomonadales bacterium]|nr:restriction endonuclease subunit S [Pseudomonadales bacterium]
MWKTVKLGDVCELAYGKALDKKDRLEIGGYPAFGANGIKTQSKAPLYDKPSIIVGRKGSAGEINKVTEPFWALDVTYYTKIDEQVITLDYLFYVLTTLNLPSLARGVKPGINRNDVYEQTIPLPPLAEQQRIVAKLDAAFAEIDRAVDAVDEKKRQCFALLKATLNAIVSFSLDCDEEKPLGEMAKFLDYRGRTPTKSEAGVRLLTAKNVRMGYIKKEPLEYVTDDTYQQHMTRGLPRVGDVVITTEAPLGLVAQIEDADVALGQRLITLQTAEEEIKNSYLKYLLMAEITQQKIHAAGTGATVKGIKASLLKKIPMNFPKSLSEQQKRADTLDAITQQGDSLLETLVKKREELAQLKSAILSQELQPPQSEAA